MIPTTLKATGAIMLTSELREFIDEKLKKIEKLLDPKDSMVRADVEVGTTGGSRTGEQFRAEINLHWSGGFVRAEATRDSMHPAIDEAVEEVRTELNKKITKHRSLARRSATHVKNIYKYFRGSI